MNAVAPNKLLRPVLPFLFLFAASPCFSQENPTYAALRSARPGAEAFGVKGFILQRDVFRFEFESGSSIRFRLWKGAPWEPCLWVRGSTT